MFEKKNLKLVSLITGIINVVGLLMFKFLKLKVSFIGSESYSLLKIAEEFGLVYLALIIGILCIAVLFLKDYLGKNQKLTELVLPIVGFVVNIIVIFYLKGKFKSELGDYGAYFDGLVKVSGSFGFYLSQVCYVVMFGVALIGSGNIDLGNEKLNSFVKEASSVTENLTEKAINVTSDITEKAINKASETIKDIKESKEEENDEVVEEEVERVEVVEEATIEVEEIVDDQPEDTIEE